MAIDWFYLIDGNRRVRSLTDDNPPDEVELFRSDESKYRLHPLKRNPLETPGRPLVYADERPATLKVSAGVIDTAPDSGTFTITDSVSGQTTAAIAYNAPASGVAGSVQTLIRASLTTHFSAATVTGDAGGPWIIDRGATGAHADITATSDALVPSGSTVNITNSQQGTGSVNERWQVRLRKVAPFFCSTWSAFDALSFAATLVTTGSATQKETHAVTWNADVYEGNCYLQVSTAGTDIRTIGPIPFNATADEFLTFLEKHPNLSAGNLVSVAYNSPGNYTIAFAESFTNGPTVTVGNNTFKVPIGDQADIGVATAESDAILGTATSADVTFEIEVREDSGKPRTIQESATLKKDLITSTPGQTTGVDNFLTEADVESGDLDVVFNSCEAISFLAGSGGYAFTDNSLTKIVTEDTAATMKLNINGTSFITLTSPNVIIGDGLNIQMGAGSVIKLDDGSAATPAISFAVGGSPTTGLYLAAADQIGISTGGTLRGTWNSGGVEVVSAVTANSANSAGKAILGPLPADPVNYGGLWFGVTPSSSNYSFLGFAGDTFVNGAASLKLRIGNGDVLSLTGARVTSELPIKLKGYTVGTLPAGSVGDTAYVTDATAPTYNGALTGGGAVVARVFYNGAAWVSQ